MEERSEENTPGKCRLQHLAEGSFQRIKPKAKSDSCGNQILEPETFPGVFVFSFLSLFPRSRSISFPFLTLSGKEETSIRAGKRKKKKRQLRAVSSISFSFLLTNFSSHRSTKSWRETVRNQDLKEVDR